MHRNQLISRKIFFSYTSEYSKVDLLKYIHNHIKYITIDTSTGLLLHRDFIINMNDQDFTITFNGNLELISSILEHLRKFAKLTLYWVKYSYIWDYTKSPKFNSEYSKDYYIDYTIENHMTNDVLLKICLRSFYKEEEMMALLDKIDKIIWELYYQTS